MTSQANDNKAILDIDNTKLSLPVRKGSFDNEVIAITELAKHQKYTFDPGFVSTASCESKITYINGAEGILLHRGYPIDQLAFHSITWKRATC